MDRLASLRDAVKALLDGGRVAGVLALRTSGRGTAPHLYGPGDQLGDLALWPKYYLPKIVDRLLQALPPPVAEGNQADGKLGLVTRGCEERGLVELAKHNQVDLGRLELIGLACTAEERDACRCDWPYPSRVDVGEKVEGILDGLVVQQEGLSPEERTEFWQQQYARCIKCYACRTVCPQCFCEVCILEDPLWVETGVLAPPFPSYHLIRAYHTVAKCVGCMECEAACPADIPLPVLYAQLRKDMEDQSGYVPGRSVEDQPPLVVETLWREG